MDDLVRRIEPRNVIVGKNTYMNVVLDVSVGYKLKCLSSVKKKLLMWRSQFQKCMIEVFYRKY